MSDKFHHPYHFIPTTGTVNGQKTPTIPYHDIASGRHPFARHDLWHQKGVSGHLACTLRLKTPTFVGGMTNKKQDTGYPKKLQHYIRNDKPAIPGNTLRGMVGSLIESLSQSALRMLRDETYSIRQQASEANGKKLGVVKYQDGKPLICKLKDRQVTLDNGHKKTVQYRQVTRHSATLFLNNRYGENIPDFLASTDNITAYYDENNHTINANQDQNHTIQLVGSLLVLDMEDDHNNTKGTNRKFEKFVEQKDITDDLIPITSAALENYKTLFNLTMKEPKEDNSSTGLPHTYMGFPHSETQPEQLRDRMFVYYRQDKNQQVTEISVSQIWRSLMPKTTHQLFDNPLLLPLGARQSDRDSLTSAEALLGVVELPAEKGNNDDNNITKNLASRIRFTDALPDGDIKQLCHPTTLKILARPKPPSPAMYFHRRGKQGDYLSKQNMQEDNTRVQPNGRKYYLHHPERQVNATPTCNKKAYWETAQAQEHEAQKMTINPLMTNQVFNFTVYFDNLSDVELELLKTALVPDEHYQHRLGLGKSLGLGSVAVAITAERHKSHQRYCPGNWTEYFSLGSHLEKSNESTLVDAETKACINILGDPRQLSYNVRPPLTPEQAKNDESETFEWFVENDHSKGQALQPVIDKLPGLYNQWNKTAEQDLITEKEQAKAKKAEQKELEQEHYQNLTPAQQCQYNLDAVMQNQGYWFEGKLNQDGQTQLTALRSDIVKRHQEWTDRDERHTVAACLQALIKRVGKPRNKARRKAVEQALAYLNAHD